MYATYLLLNALHWLPLYKTTKINTGLSSWGSRVLVLEKGKHTTFTQETGICVNLVTIFFQILTSCFGHRRMRPPFVNCKRTTKLYCHVTIRLNFVMWPTVIAVIIPYDLIRIVVHEFSYDIIWTCSWECIDHRQIVYEWHKCRCVFWQVGTEF